MIESGTHRGLPKRSTLAAAATAAMLFATGAGHAAPVVYNFDTTIVSATPTGNPAQSDTVRGTITTDGTLGALSSANIVSWNLDLIDNLDAANDYTLTTADSSLVELLGSALSATATELLFDFSGTGEFLIQANNPGAYSGWRYFCFSTGVYACLQGETIAPASVFADGVDLTGSAAPVGVVPLGPPPTGGAVPEPATLALAGLALVAAGCALRSSETSRRERSVQA